MANKNKNNNPPIPKISDMKPALHDRKNEQRQYVGAQYFKQLVFMGIQELYEAQGYNKHALAVLQEIQKVFIVPEEQIDKESKLSDQQAKCPHLGKIISILSVSDKEARCPVCQVKLLQDKDENGAPAWRHP